MAVLANNLCGFEPPEGGKKCSRRIKADELRCWQHQGMRSAGESSPIIDIEVIERQRELIKGFGEMASPTRIKLGHPSGLRRSLTLEFTPLDPEAYDAVDKAYESLGSDLSVPEHARQSLLERGLEKFIEALVGGGINKKRVSRMRVGGFNRMTVNGTKQKSDDAFHEVVVLDAGTQHEVVIDPFIAMFAPVRNTGQSVEDQLPSGATPFADLPWIGSVRSYVGGDYLWWDKFRMETGGPVR